MKKKRTLQEVMDQQPTKEQILESFIAEKDDFKSDDAMEALYNLDSTAQEKFLSNSDFVLKFLRGLMRGEDEVATEEFKGFIF